MIEVLSLGSRPLSCKVSSRMALKLLLCISTAQARRKRAVRVWLPLGLKFYAVKFRVKMLL